jgi:hypothetical protein
MMTNLSSAAIENRPTIDDIMRDHGTVPVTGGIDG